MKKKRLIARDVNFLLSALSVVFVLVFFEQLVYEDIAWFRYVVLAVPVLPCFLAGVFAGKRMNWQAYSVMVLSAAAAGAVTGLLQYLSGNQDVPFLMISVLAAGFMVLMGAVSDRSFPALVFFPVMIGYIIITLILGFRAGPNDWMFAFFTLAYFLLGLLSANIASLQQGIHNVKNGNIMSPPAGMRSKNFIMLAVFLGIALFLAIFPPSRKLIELGVQGVLSLAWWLFLLFDSLFTPQRVPPGGPEPTVEPTPEVDLIPQIDSHNPAGQFMVGTMFIFVVIAGAIIFFVAVINGKVDFGSRASRRRQRKLDPDTDEEYEEEVENLFDFKNLFRRKKKGASFWERLTTRPERFDDMPDNRTRVRFAYKLLLKVQGTPKSGGVVTPLEYSATLESDPQKRLAGDYSALKYDRPDAPVPDEAAQNAGLAAKELRNAKDLRKKKR